MWHSSIDSRQRRRDTASTAPTLPTAMDSVRQAPDVWLKESPEIPAQLFIYQECFIEYLAISKRGFISIQSRDMDSTHEGRPTMTPTKTTTKTLPP